MGGLIASRQMRASPAPPQVATRPALRDQDGNGQDDEQRNQRGQDHDHYGGHGPLRCCVGLSSTLCLIMALAVKSSPR
jgi:hypothetical protein